MLGPDVRDCEIGGHATDGERTQLQCRKLDQSSSDVSRFGHIVTAGKDPGEKLARYVRSAVSPGPMVIMVESEVNVKPYYKELFYARLCRSSRQKRQGLREYNPMHGPSAFTRPH